MEETEENEIKMHFIIRLLKTSNKETCLKAHQKDSHIHGKTKGRISLSGKHMFRRQWISKIMKEMNSSYREQIGGRQEIGAGG